MLNSQIAGSLYGRGVASLRKSIAGDADISAAKLIKPNVVEEFARYGMK